MAAATGDLYVTGLPAGFNEDRVKAIFTPYGPVKSIKVLPPHPQKDDVAAIVSMESPDQAQWLIDNVSGKVPSGLTTPIDIKKKMAQDWSSKGFGKGAGPGFMPPPWQMMQMMQWYGKGKGGGKGWSGPSTFKVDESGGVLGEFTGTIKSFADGTGYGFIECEQIKAEYNKDIFLHRDHKKGYQVGNTVKFTCVLTGKGQPQAKDLKSGFKD